MKKQVHRNGKGWKFIATSRGVQIHTPSPNWIYLIGSCVQAVAVFLGLWLSDRLPLLAAMGVSLLAGLFVRWFLGFLPDFGFKKNGLIVADNQGGEHKTVPLHRLVLVSDPQHKDVVIANPGTGGVFTVWVAESEEDRQEVVRVLHQYIQKEISFSERVPGLYG